MTGIDPSLSEKLDIFIADSQDVTGLKKMVKDTKVVLSTTGPFTVYGNYLVALCAQYGTHYCDTTGEVDWVKVMIEKYDKLAVKSGAQLVSCCGFDCIPFDLSTLAVSLELKKKGE